MCRRAILLLAICSPAAFSLATPPVIRDEPRAIEPAQYLPEALRRRATADLTDGTVRELADWLRQEFELTVLIDKRALAEEGLSLSDPVEDRLENAPLYQLLDRLRRHDLAWWYESDVLYLSTVDEEYERLVTETYNLADLLDNGYDAESIVEVITAVVAADTWAENGGGEAEILAIGDVLFVNQTSRIQREIAATLASLKTFGRQTFVYEPKAHQAIREGLARRVSADYRDTSLQEALADLAEQSGAPIRIDHASLDDLGIHARDPVSLRLADRPLATVLRALLDQWELDALPSDGVLMVMSAEQALRELRVAVYDTRDLCRDDTESEALLGAITSQAAADTWAENGGGEAEIRMVKPGVMVISQTEHVHAGVLRLLEMYRAALRASKPRAVASDDEEISTVYYRVYQPTAEELQELLPSLVAPGSWSTPDNPEAVGEITLVTSLPEQKQKSTPLAHSVLIVRQTNAVHREIADVLDRIRSGDDFAGPSEGGGWGGGLGGGGGGSFGSGLLPTPAGK